MPDPRKIAAFALVAAAIALAAYEAGRRAERPAAPSNPDPALPTPGPEAPAPTSTESHATFEVPLETPAAAPEEPSPIPPATPSRVEPLPLVEERPGDEPGRCLTLEAFPSSVGAYGARGPAVQLIVRARNGCATAFSGPRTYFRVSAAAAAGYELASASGRFAGEIPPFGVAETLVAIETDPTRAATYRVELR